VDLARLQLTLKLKNMTTTPIFSAVIAFAIQDGGSREIRESRLLPGLAMTVVEEALRREQTGDDGEVNRWLLECFREM
jgi:hypothetical protein